MAMKTLWQTPAPSSGFLEGVSFKVLPKRTCALSFQYESLEGQMETCELRFVGVEAFKCTYLTSLTVEMIESAYDRLVDLGASQWLHEVKDVFKTQGASPALKHLRICFDDGPCYEFLCSGLELAR
jgi:hypothetical protein